MAPSSSCRFAAHTGLQLPGFGSWARAHDLRYKLVRPVNFAAGAYLGWTSSLLLLTIFAPTLSSCPAILAVGTCSAVLVGLLCAMNRASVMAVLGVVAGEMLGDVFFKTFLASIAPEYIAFGCIGFFAVLLAVLSAYAGDFAFQCFCAFFGSYLAVCNFTKLVLVPYAPNGEQFLPFLSYKPELTQVMVSGKAIVGSPYLYGPVLVVAALTAFGTWAQVKLLAKAKKYEEMTQRGQIGARRGCARCSRPIDHGKGGGYEEP